MPLESPDSLNPLMVIPSTIPHLLTPTWIPSISTRFEPVLRYPSPLRSCHPVIHHPTRYLSFHPPTRDPCGIASAVFSPGGCLVCMVLPCSFVAHSLREPCSICTNINKYYSHRPLSACTSPQPEHPSSLSTPRVVLNLAATVSPTHESVHISVFSIHSISLTFTRLSLLSLSRIPHFDLTPSFSRPVDYPVPRSTITSSPDTLSSSSSPCPVHSPTTSRVGCLPISLDAQSRLHWVPQVYQSM